LFIQLWSYNYDPEPTGIGPVSRTLALALQDRGHRVEVIAAHPHYPAPAWGSRRLPYREIRSGISVLRLPLWIGRASSAERYRQELTFSASLIAALPTIRRPDVAVVASPSFPALVPALVNHCARRTPWILWLHDILPDGAAATGLVSDGTILRAARRLEVAAYRGADRIVVLSRAFEQNLEAKGVAPAKLELIYDPATRAPAGNAYARVGSAADGELRILSMGNIGHSQGLAPLVRAFEAHPRLAKERVSLIITGTGVAASGVEAEVRSEKVEVLGLVDDARLERELERADIALVTQQYDGGEFNIPSKLMNFMVYGLPILAAVNPAGEVARLVNEAGAGWVVDSSRPEMLPAKVAELLSDPAALSAPAERALRYAQENFSVRRFADRFESVLSRVAKSPSSGIGRRLQG
jgi:colanic acid biosynthesis glycosyl transferase WcaI